MSCVQHTMDIITNCRKEDRLIHIEKVRIFLRLPKEYDGVVFAFFPTRGTTEHEGSSAKVYEMAKEDGNTICFRLK